MLENLKNKLIEKLDEWNHNDHYTEIVIDCFLTTMVVVGISKEEQISIIEEAAKSFTGGFIETMLLDNANDIKKNIVN
jgi:hypothetical protein